LAVDTGQRFVEADRTDERGIPEPGLPVSDEITAPAGAEKRRRRLVDLSVMAIFVGLGFWVCARYFHHFPNRISRGDTEDTTLFEWYFAHGARSVFHLENPLFSFQQGAPLGVNIAANASVLGLSIPLAPLTMLVGPHVMVIFVTIASLAMSAWSAYFVLSRYVVAHPLAAFVGGLFFGFAPGFVDRAQGQLHLISNWLLPFVVLFVFKLTQPGGRSVRNGVILGLLVTYQVFISEAMLVVTTIGCGVAVAAYFLFRFRELPRRATGFLTGGATALGVAVPLLAFPLWFAFAGPRHVSSIPPMTLTWNENLAALVTHSNNALAGDGAVSRAIEWAEMNTWFGWGVCLAVVLAAILLWRRSLIARVAVLTGLACLWLALGSHLAVGVHQTAIPGPWLVVHKLPPFTELPPGRMAFALVAAVALLLALLCDQISAFPTRQARVVGYALLAAAILPSVGMPLRARVRVPAPHFLASGDWKPYVKDGTTLVDFPLPINYPGCGLEELGWQAELGLGYATPSGYSLYPGVNGGPTSYNPPARQLASTMFQICRSRTLPATVTEADRAGAIEDLRYWRTSIIVIPVGHKRAPDLRLYVERLFGPPQRVDDVYLWDVRQLTGVG
jgi:hypothetical protein